MVDAGQLPGLRVARPEATTFRVRTGRLELMAASYEMLRAEQSGKDRLADLLGAAVPDAWPPPLNDEASLAWTVNYLVSHPGAEGWSMWYFLLNPTAGVRTLIGNGGFKGAPSPDGVVEVGYSLLEPHQGKGYATEATMALLRWAFEHPAVSVVAAETYPHLRTSIRVLEKCGFIYGGQGTDILTIRFELKRREFAASSGTLSTGG